MIREYQTKTNIGIGLGLLLGLSGRVLMLRNAAEHGGNGGLYAVGSAMSVAGMLLAWWGCWNYARAKGYSGWLGLIALIPCIGLLVLILLVDKAKEQSPAGG